jgi:hypothetical protein
MKKLIYELIDGTVVTTLKEAKASDLRYKVSFENVLTENGALSKKRQELMNKYGFVPVVKRI